MKVIVEVVERWEVEIPDEFKIIDKPANDVSYDDVADDTWERAFDAAEAAVIKASANGYCEDKEVVAVISAETGNVMCEL